MGRSTSKSVFAMSTQTETVGVQEAADILKVHSSTIEEYLRAGILNGAKAGKCWLMMRKDVVAFAQKLVIEQTAARLQARGRRMRSVRDPAPNLSRSTLRSSGA